VFLTGMVVVRAPEGGGWLAESVQGMASRWTAGRTFVLRLDTVSYYVFFEDQLRL